MADRVGTQLVICDTCAHMGGQAKGAAWAARLKIATAAMDVTVTTTSCMNMCQSPVAFALQSKGKATYLFADADPETDTQDMLALLDLYGAAPDGWITDARSIGRLRSCLKGRVPAR